MRCSECGVDWSEHRWLGDFALHPGLADTWEEHVRIEKSMTLEQKQVFLQQRQARLRQEGKLK